MYIVVATKRWQVLKHGTGFRAIKCGLDYWRNHIKIYIYMCWFMQLLIVVIRALLCYVSRDKVQKDLCRLLSKPVGRAMSPLEGAKDINLFMHLLWSTEMRFSYTVYKHKYQVKQNNAVCFTQSCKSNSVWKNGIRAEKSALGPNRHRMFNQMMWCIYLNWVG